MKLSIHRLREEYGPYLSDVEIFEAICNGDLKAYFHSEEEGEQIISYKLVKQVWGKEIRKAQFMQFLISPKDSFGPGGYGPSLDLKWTPKLEKEVEYSDEEDETEVPKMQIVFLINMYFKKNEIEEELLPKKVPIFNYIRKISNDYGVVKVRGDDGEWVIEEYKREYGLIIKALVETFIEHEDTWINLDDLIERIGIGDKGQPQIDKFFPKRIIKNYIDSGSKHRHIKIKKEKIIPR
jgi:hypothetical protein